MWVRFDDQYPIHRKIAPLDDACFRLATEATFWCNRNKTNGRIAVDELDVVSCRATKKRAEILVKRGIWHAPGFVCESPACPPAGSDGWVVHDYLDYQWSAEKILAEQQRNAERQQRFRERHAGEENNAGSNGVSNAPGNPVSNGVTNGPRNAVTNGVTNGVSNGVSNPPSNGPVTAPRSRSRNNPSSSPYVAIATALKMDEDDEEVAKVLEHIKTEHRPTALGPYVRAIAEKGDLPAILDQIRAVGRPHESPATHDYDPDEMGVCRHMRPGARQPCPLPPSHSTHRTAGASAGAVARA